MKKRQLKLRAKAKDQIQVVQKKARRAKGKVQKEIIKEEPHKFERVEATAISFGYATSDDFESDESEAEDDDQDQNLQRSDHQQRQWRDWNHIDVNDPNVRPPWRPCDGECNADWKPAPFAWIDKLLGRKRPPPCCYRVELEFY